MGKRCPNRALRCSRAKESFSERLFTSVKSFTQMMPCKAGMRFSFRFFPYLVAHEQQACLAVVDDVVYIIRLELVQDGHDDGAVGNGGQERHAPVSAVASTQGDFVSGPDIGRFEEQVHFGYFTCHVLVLQALSVEIRERFPVPVLLYAVFDKFYQFVFHIVWTYILVSETKVQKTRHIRFFVGDDFEFRA